MDDNGNHGLAHMHHMDDEALLRRRTPPPSPVSMSAQGAGATDRAVDPHDDDEEAECRVCRGEAEPDRRLFAPCKCSGSIRFTHSDCLEQWLDHSGKSYCELCGHKFTFQPLYDANAPDVLPWSEVVATVLQMVCFKWVPFVIRGVLVLVLWLGIAPWCTSWLYRMWLLRASAMAHVNFSERFGTDHIVADIFSGVILIVVIIFSFLALMSFADFLRFHLDHIEEPVEEEHLHHHHNHVQQPFRRQQPNQEGVPPVQQPRLVEPDVADVVIGDVQNGVRQVGENNNAVNGNGGEVRMPFEGVLAQHPREELGIPVAVERVEEEPEQQLRQRRPFIGGDEPRVPVDNAAVPPPPQAPRNAPRNRPNNNNNNPNRNGEWDDDFDHMEINIAMDELLGLRGDIVVLFRNVSWLLAFNGAYLGLFAFIPYTLGSTIFSASAKIVSSLPFIPKGISLMPADGSVMLITDGDVSLGSFFLRSLATAIETSRRNGDCLQLVDLCTCAMGYVSICFTIVLWRWMVTTASSYIHRPLMGGLLWALRCLTAIVKVSTLLLLKMVVLPIILGLGMDFATLQLFLASPQDRITFCMQHMVGALLIHWVLGITFMLFVTVSVLQLREVMHPDILAKVIRPQEAHPDLLRSLLSEKCVKHARRMILSLVIYAGLLMVLIHVPIQLVYMAMPHQFPLTLRFQHYIPEIQVPLELLIVHLVVLGILEHAKNEIGRFQHLGFVFMCKQLNLTEYLLPRVQVTWSPRVGKRGDVLVLAPPPLHFHPHAELPPEQLRVDGHRYLPWPEEGLDDPHPIEYNLLPRKKPSHVSARLFAVVFAMWLALVASMGALIFGTFYLGRVCLGPFERLSGILHDPLALAAGVQIVWYMAHGMNVLNVMTLPEDHVELALVQRGYCVKNMTPVNAVTSVVGWAFVCPFLVGYLIASCVPSAASSWFESFWVGYLLFNLFAWCVCCFRARGRRRRNRRRGRQDFPRDDEFEEDFVDFVGHDDHVLDDELDDEDLDDDDLDEDLDDHDEHHGPQPGVGEVRNNAPAQPEGFIACLRHSYKQLMFNVTVHDNDAVRLRTDDIRDRCFDLELFMVNVLYPIVAVLSMTLVFCMIQSSLLIYLWSATNPEIHKTAFSISALGTISATFLVRSHGYVTQWIANFAESIRNERYLIGRQLQDMVR